MLMRMARVMRGTAGWDEGAQGGPHAWLLRRAAASGGHTGQRLALPGVRVVIAHVIGFRSLCKGGNIDRMDRYDVDGNERKQKLDRLPPCLTAAWSVFGDSGVTPAAPASRLTLDGERERGEPARVRRLESGAEVFDMLWHFFSAEAFRGSCRSFADESTTSSAWRLVVS